MIKVSVIVPTYNVEQYLRQALDSLKRQTLREMEFICVNDGSTDGSVSILQEYADADARFRVISKRNGGYGAAMNAGIREAKGEYVGILEPDDYVCCEMFEELYETACKNRLDFVKADFYRFSTNENGDQYYRYEHLDKSGEWYGKVINPSLQPELTRFILNTWSGIYRRAFLEEHQILHHETPGAAFQDNGFFWQTFMYAKRAMFLNKPYYRNRRDNPNSSVCNPEKVYTMNMEYDFIRSLFMKPENREKWALFKGYFHLKRFGNYEFTVGRIDQKFRREYVKRISAEMRRAEQLGELDLSLMSKTMRNHVQLLISDPDRYYRTVAVTKDSAFRTPEEKLQMKLDKSREKLKAMSLSTTYRTGKAVLWIPKRLIGVIKGFE